MSAEVEQNLPLRNQADGVRCNTPARRSCVKRIAAPRKLTIASGGGHWT